MRRKKEKIGPWIPIEIEYRGRIIYRGPAYCNSGLRAPAEKRHPFIIVPREIAESAGIKIIEVIETRGFSKVFLGKTPTTVRVRVKAEKIQSKWVNAYLYVCPFRKDIFINTTLRDMLGVIFLSWDEGLWVLMDILPENIRRELRKLAQR